MVMLSMLLLLLPLPGPALTVRVLSSVRQVVEHKPHDSGATLLHSSLAGQNTLTICARFVSYLFTHQGMDIPKQGLMTLGGGDFFNSVAMTEQNPYYKERAGEIWRNGEVAFYEFGDLIKVNWKPGVWNSACFDINLNSQTYQVWFDGKIISKQMLSDDAHVSTFKSSLSHDKPISIMGYPAKDGKHSQSMFGAMTDVNIWNRSLSQSEVEQWSRCELETGGNLLDWTTAQWEAVGLQEEKVKEEEICVKNLKKVFIVSQDKRTFNDTMNLCKNALEGDMAVATDKRIMEEMIKAVKAVTNNCGIHFYSGYTDRVEEEVWFNVNTGENMTFSPWEEGEPDSLGGNQDHTWFNAETGQIGDIDQNKEYCPICSVPRKTSFQLQGVCRNSFIDRFYVLQSDKELLGFMQNKMFWTHNNRRWEIVNMITNETEAFMNKSSDFPFGTHPWYFTDNSNCSDPGQKWRNLNFHGKVEQPGKFCCDDGTCMESDCKCDGDYDCLDMSDEKECEMMIVPSTYNKDIPPRPLSQGGSRSPLQIEVRSTILDLIKIDEIESVISGSFALELKWKDCKLNYSFLNNNPQKNVIRESIEKKIWMPKIKFITLLKQGDIFQSARNFFIEKSVPGEVENEINETYSGKDNFLILETINQASFICSFDNIKLFPFGSQDCSFKLFLPGVDNKLTQLIPGKLTDIGPKSVGDYQVVRWTVTTGPVIAADQKIVKFSYHKIENSVGLTFTVRLTRKIGDIILVTYLPTFLMNLINQAANYISSPDKYETIYAINITCMMVLASIYLAVSTSLPSTTEIKPIEIWLLFSLVYPVLVILVNILMQVKQYYQSRYVFQMTKLRESKEK